MPKIRPDVAASRALEARALGTRLAAARSSAGLSQSDAARALAVPQSQIAKVELGLRQLPFVEGLRLAALYSIAPEDLAPAGDEPVPE